VPTAKPTAEPEPDLQVGPDASKEPSQEIITPDESPQYDPQHHMPPEPSHLAPASPASPTTPTASPAAAAPKSNLERFREALEGAIPPGDRSVIGGALASAAGGVRGHIRRNSGRYKDFVLGSGLAGGGAMLAKAGYNYLTGPGRHDDPYPEIKFKQAPSAFGD